MTKLHGKIVSLVSCMALILVMLVAFVATGASAAVIPAENADTTSVGTPTGVTDPEWEKVPAKELGAVINDGGRHKPVYPPEGGGSLRAAECELRQRLEMDL